MHRHSRNGIQMVSFTLGGTFFDFFSISGFLTFSHRRLYSAIRAFVRVLRYNDIDGDPPQHPPVINPLDPQPVVVQVIEPAPVAVQPAGVQPVLPKQLRRDSATPGPGPITRSVA